jgi:hypothetical protein
VKFVLLIHNASNLCRETKRGTFDEPAGETDSPRIDAFFRGYVGPPPTATAIGVSRVGRD